MTNGKSRLQEFEALRALSIILLLALHSDIFSLDLFGFALDPISHFVGAFLLGSFFFLAGYFQEVSMSKPTWSAVSYVKSKFIRIFPPYWLALALFVLVMGYSMKRFDLTIYALNLQFIFLPNFVKQLLTLWYISLVTGFYVLFGLLAYWFKSGRALAVWAVMIFGAAYLLSNWTGLLDGRFFVYYFIFLAGIYFARYENLRERLFGIHIGVKILAALLGAVAFRLALVSGIIFTSAPYLLAVDLFILSWVQLWLSIFRTAVGGWALWTPISTASFFAYLLHRPIWAILMVWLAPYMGLSAIMFQFIPGSIATLVICYFMQNGYDALLRSFQRPRMTPASTGD